MTHTTHIEVMTIKQPWAGLILTGRKTVEHRTWRTHHRGRLHIHTATRDDTTGWETLTPEDVAAVESLALHRGAIVGSVTVVGCDGTPGGWQWQLADPLILESPIPAVGRLSIWRCATEQSLTDSRPLPLATPILNGATQCDTLTS